MTTTEKAKAKDKEKLAERLARRPGWDWNASHGTRPSQPGYGNRPVRVVGEPIGIERPRGQCEQRADGRWHLKSPEEHAAYKAERESAGATT